jgi:predicted ATPase
MKITSFEYRDHAIEWTLERIEFNSLTLLVGASGVGKTRILQALLHLKKIARGASLNGVQWQVQFSNNGNSYEWSGLFENKGFFYDEDDKDKPSIENEKLYINDELIVDRNDEGIIFNNEKTVKLSQKESMLSLLKEEEQIKVIHTEFSKIFFDFNPNIEGEINRFIVDNKAFSFKHHKYTDLINIRNSDENLKVKLYLIYLNVPTTFEEIKNAFIDVFPYVEDLRMEILKVPNMSIPLIQIQIKEMGIENWIDQRKLSSGMYRTLMHIAELYLCADGTIILIDEFENSLGINCIDDITNSIVTHNRNLQFIMTSHHPYIINNIDLNNWKILTRKAGMVKNYNASQLNLGKSKHEAFTQLINLDKYLDGVEL